MRRAGLIVAGVAGVVVLAGLGAWLALFRDTTEPVSVEEAVTSFRTETEPNGAPSQISPGVYVYATTGYEKTDALTGVMHSYPSRSTITVVAADCGMRLTWRVLKGRSTEWTVCVTAEGWSLRSQDERHTFFGTTQRTTYVCENTPIRPLDRSVTSWSVTCSTGDARETGVARIVPGATARIGDALLPVLRVRKATTFSGEIRGSARYDFWFHERLGVPVWVAMRSRTTNDSPVGDVHYEEDVVLVLRSLRPRR
ncbi:MAG TPA: hypothetical protein VFT94_00825 [Gaiellaceae bacterium]|nr:hypothetical protein [Gaiellaceae bacterium]